MKNFWMNTVYPWSEWSWGYLDDDEPKTAKYVSRTATGIAIFACVIAVIPFLFGIVLSILGLVFGFIPGLQMLGFMTAGCAIAGRIFLLDIPLIWYGYTRYKKWLASSE